MNEKKFGYLKFIVENQIDKIGMHKSYNLLEHYKFINNLLHQSGKDTNKFLRLNDKMQGPKLYCVGDDWQAIYRFRGADYNLMVNFRTFLGIKQWLLNSYTRIELDETFIDPYKNLFKLNLKIQDFKSSIDVGKRILELDFQKAPISYFNLALAYDLNKDYKKAIVLYKVVETRLPRISYLYILEPNDCPSLPTDFSSTNSPRSL